MATNNGTSGDDNIDGTSGADNLNGGAGNDDLYGDAGNDRLNGGSGNDILNGGSGSDVVNGDSGNDTLVYNLTENLNGSKDVYTGGSGIDTVLLQLSASQWVDSGVRAQLEAYIAHLAAVRTNTQGEVSNGSASDFVFHFDNGTTLTVQMMEKLVVAVQSVSGGPYVPVNYLQSLITGDSTGSVLEAGGVANGTAGTPTATGNLYADDLDGPDDAFQPVAPGALTQYGTYSVTADGLWTYTLDNTRAATQALTGGQPATDTFTVYSQDGTAQVVTINITGANDNATITVTAGGDYTVIEAGGVANGTAGDPSAAGDLDVSDVDAGEAKFQAPASLAGTYGDFTFNADTGAWTYTLDNTRAATQALTGGQPVTDSLTVNSYDGTDSETITVNITGANDNATITGTNSGVVVEAGGVANGTAGTPTASGNLLATDVDNPNDVFQAVAAGAGTANGYGTYGVTADGVWTYTLDNTNATVQALNVGSPALVDTFTVYSQDGTAQLVTVTINGSNDAAVITGPTTGIVTEATAASPGTPTATGNLLATDVDNPNDVFQAVAAGAGTANGYGTYGITADGVWTYTLDNTNAAVEALGNGGTLTDSFTVYSQDGTAQQVNITINGADDRTAPTDIRLQANAAVVVQNNFNFQFNATLFATDADPGAMTFTFAAGGTSIASGTNTFNISGNTLTSGGFLGNNANHTLVIRATQAGDPAGVFYDETFNIVTGVANNSADNLPGSTNDDVLYGGNNNDILINDIMIGGDGDDTLFGQSGNDQLFGGVDNDFLYGGDNDDTLEGGAGVDNLIGGAGIDTATYANATSSVTVNLATGSASGADGNDILSEVENVVGSGFNDILVGNTLDNSLTGGAGDDDLSGGAGLDSLNGGIDADDLDGGSGLDTLTGGTGADTFIFNSADGDRVTDFLSADDVLDFQQSLFPLANGWTVGGSIDGIVSVTGGGTSIAGADLVIWTTGAVTVNNKDSATDIDALLDAQPGTFNGGVFVLAHANLGGGSQPVALYYDADANDQGGAAGATLVAVFTNYTSLATLGLPTIASDYISH